MSNILTQQSMNERDVEDRTANAIAQWLLDTRFSKPGREAEWSRYLANTIRAGAWRMGAP